MLTYLCCEPSELRRELTVYVVCPAPPPHINSLRINLLVSIHGVFKILFTTVALIAGADRTDFASVRTAQHVTPSWAPKCLEVLLP